MNTHTPSSFPSARAAARSCASALLVAAALLAPARVAGAQDEGCTPGWLATFVNGQGMNTTVLSFGQFDDGSGGGPRLYAGGSFTQAGGVPVNHIARWDLTHWAPVGTGVGFGEVFAMTVYDDGLGDGPALYAAGSFGVAGGVPDTQYIAKWDGATWSAVGGGTNNWVRALTVYDNGGPPVLIAGGSFSNAGGVAANNIASWNGTSWRALGGGPTNGVNKIVDTLTVYDDGLGGGPALYAGGEMTMAGGVPASAVAKWNGATWSALGSGMGTTIGTPEVEALAVYDAGLGAGPELYAVGRFTSAGGAPANYIARWNGLSWSDVGGGLSHQASELAVQAGESGVLYAASVPSAGGVEVNEIGVWDGTSWSALDANLDGTVNKLFAVQEGHPGQEQPVLYVAGYFPEVAGIPASYLAAWGCGAAPGTWSNLGFGLAGDEGVPQLAGLGTLAPGSPGAIAVTEGNPHAIAQLFVSLTGTPTPFKGGTLVPVPVLTTIPTLANGGGQIVLSWPAFPAGLQPLTSIFLQCALVDDVAPQGVALSNALRGRTPGP